MLGNMSNWRNIMEEIVKKSLEYLQNGELFLAKEMSLYIQEVLKYALVKSHTVGAVLLLCFLSFLIMFIRGFREDSDDLIVGGSVGGAIFLLLLLTSVMTIVQIHIAPRMYLVEYFKRMVE